MRFEDFNKNPIQAILDELSGGNCQWQIIDFANLPQEIRYALELGSSRYKQMQQLTDKGVYLALRSHKNIPEEISSSINCVSDLVQLGSDNAWIENFLSQGEKPLWSKEDQAQAAHGKLDLESELKKIQDYKNEHQKLFVVSSGSVCLTAEEQNLIDQINQELARISGKLMPIKLVAQAESRWEFAIEMFLLSLITLCLALVFGAMNFYLGVFLAVVLPGLAAEAYRAYLGHQSGFASWQIKAKAMRRLPFALAGMFLAGLGLWLYEYAGAAVIFFALAAVGLPLSHFVAFALAAWNDMEKQKAMGRIDPNARLLHGADWVRIAAFVSLPVLGWLLVRLSPGLIGNYFFLTALGLYAWVVPSSAVGAWSAVKQWLFRLRLRRALGKSVYRTDSLV